MNKNKNLPPCLIFSNYALNPRDGGPSGFLGQNLKGEFSPLYRLGGDGPVNFRLRFSDKIRIKIFNMHSYTVKTLRLPTRSSFTQWLKQARLRFIAEHAYEYRILWFHDIWNLYACIDLFKEGQKIILQPHTPELPSREVLGNKQSKADVEWTEMAEKVAFSKAHIVVLPNKHVLPIFDSLLSNNQKICFLPSGARVEAPRFHIPLENECVFYLYIGRRIDIKGFSTVINAFKMAYSLDKRLRLLLIGNGEKIEIPGIIDIGFSSEATSWMRSCDYLISANQQSYFDLTMMEALGTGTPVIYFPTGGHAELNSYNSTGLIATKYANQESLKKSILLNTIKRSLNEPSCQANRNIYTSQYSDTMYRERLNMFLKEFIDIDF